MMYDVFSSPNGRAPDPNGDCSLVNSYNDLQSLMYQRKTKISQTEYCASTWVTGARLIHDKWFVEISATNDN